MTACTTCVARAGIVTDWRSTSLLASRFWTRHGFVPVRYRLHRLIE